MTEALDRGTGTGILKTRTDGVRALSITKKKGDPELEKGGVFISESQAEVWVAH